MKKDKLKYAAKKTSPLLIVIACAIALIVLAPTLIHTGIAIFFLAASIAMTVLVFRSYYINARTKHSVYLSGGESLPIIFDADIKLLDRIKVLDLVADSYATLERKCDQFEWAKSEHNTSLTGNIYLSTLLSNVVFRVRKAPIEAAGRKGVAAATYHEIKKTYFDMNQITKNVIVYEMMLYIMESVKPHSTEAEKQDMMFKFINDPESFKDYL